MKSTNSHKISLQISTYFLCCNLYNPVRICQLNLECKDTKDKMYQVKQMMDVDYTLLFMLTNFIVKEVVDNLIYALLSNFFGQVPNFEIWR